jgi:hypothetical protein
MLCCFIMFVFRHGKDTPYLITIRTFDPGCGSPSKEIRFLETGTSKL